MPRFACATWRPIHANTGGVLSPNLGLILHHQAGNGSLHGFFGNPAAKVSAHFWISKTGVIEQYVDTNVVAWHGKSLNSRYVGVETEGCGSAPHAEPMTEAMIAAMGRLYAEGMRVHGWANAMANADGQRGLGFHRMAVATGCPCDVRLNLRPEILRRASGQAPSAPTAPPAGAQPTPQYHGIGSEDSSMAMTTHPDGKRIDLAVIAMGGDVWHYRSDTGDLTKTTKASLGGKVRSVSLTWANGALFLVAQDVGNRLQARILTGTTWSPWGVVTDAVLNPNPAAQ